MKAVFKIDAYMGHVCVIQKDIKIWILKFLGFEGLEKSSYSQTTKWYLLKTWYYLLLILTSFNYFKHEICQRTSTLKDIFNLRFIAGWKSLHVLEKTSLEALSLTVWILAWWSLKDDIKQPSEIYRQFAKT